MTQGEIWGNEYMEVLPGGSATFFTGWVPMQAIAPVSEAGGPNVIGRGTEVGGRLLGCAHCARAETSSAVKNRAA